MRYFLFISALLTFSFVQASADYNFGGTTDIYYSTLDDDFGANFSHIWGQVNLGDASFENLIAGDKEQEKGSVAWQINLRVSSLPWALRSSTEDKLEEEVTTAVSYLIDQAMADNPNLAGLPIEVRDSIRQELIATTVSDQMLKIDDRLDQIQLETSLQEISVGRAQMISENSSIYIKLGKGQVHSSFGESDTLAIQPDRALRAGGTAATGYVSFGHVIAVGEATVQTEVLVFKSRNAWFNAQEYVAKIVNLDEEAFEDHKEITDLNSVMLKSSYTRGNYSISLSLANHAGLGNNADTKEASVTASWEHDNHRAQATAFTADNNYRGLDSSYSLLYGYKLGAIGLEQVEVYTTVSANRGFDNPFTSRRESISYESYSLGINYDFFTSRQCDMTAKLEGVQYKGWRDDKIDTLVGVHATCSFK